jgi:hypothetical protein
MELFVGSVNFLSAKNVQEKNRRREMIIKEGEE